MRPRTRRPEPTIALINIVFLMLIFFLVAGTLAPAQERDVQLVEADALAVAPPADVLVIHADGRLRAGGVPVAAPADFLRSLEAPASAPVRLLPDRDLPARALIATARALRAAGAAQVVILTQRGTR